MPKKKKGSDSEPYTNGGSNPDDITSPTQDESENLMPDTESIEFSDTSEQASVDSVDSSDEAEKIKNELASLKDSNLRIMAEFDNFRKRSQKEKEQLYPIAVAETVKKILPVLDNFHRALDAETTDEAYKAGFTMILHQLEETLKDIGVTEIKALGEPFNPELHNAVIMVDADNLEPNTVAEVLQNGYEYDGKVIRHAMVKVAN